MILFDEYDHREQSLLERYGLKGSLLDLPGGPRSERVQPPTLPDNEQRLRGADWLVGHVRQLRLDADDWRFPDEDEVGEPVRPTRPRLFVSHRRADRECAMRVAWLADQAGFDVWIDVLDPVLSDPKILSYERVVATVIEMSLLNSTHLCAVFTPATAGSQWLPYEYGRAKDKVTLSTRTGCAFHTVLAPSALPEWTLLGATENDDPGVADWLSNEMRKWGGPPGPTNHWPASIPEPKKLWEPCCGKDAEACADT